MEPMWMTLVVQYLLQSPLYIVWLAGLVVTLRNWQRYPRPALLTVIALVIFLLRALVSTFLNATLPAMVGGDMTRAGFLFGISNFLQALVGAVAWVLILVAVYGWRDARTPRVA